VLKHYIGSVLSRPHDDTRGTEASRKTPLSIRDAESMYAVYLDTTDVTYNRTSLEKMHLTRKRTRRLIRPPTKSSRVNLTVERVLVPTLTQRNGQ
jgi:hypothetical protein